MPALQGYEYARRNAQDDFLSRCICSRNRIFSAKSDAAIKSSRVSLLHGATAIYLEVTSPRESPP